MATNPRYPEPEPKHEHPRLVVEKKNPFPWTLVAIVIAAALLAAIVIWMPRTPKATMRPAQAKAIPQPVSGEILLEGLKITPDPTGNSISIDGRLTNAGTRNITGVAVQAMFLQSGGQTPVAIDGKMMELTTSGATRDFVQDPIKPNDIREFRVVFDHVPQNWDHQIPALTITTVTAQ